MSLAVEKNIGVQTHGRYIVRSAHTAAAAGILVGFHGYGESADVQFDRLEAMADSRDWTLLSIQGLHRFYQRRTQEVVASWMTRQDRESAMTDNAAYVSQVLEREELERLPGVPIVFAGFSQGVAMAFRAAAHCSQTRLHVVAVGGDVPPELARRDLARLSSVFLCRGRSDPWYSRELFQSDLDRLRDAAVIVRQVEFEGGHEWSAELATDTTGCLRQCRREPTS